MKHIILITLFFATGLFSCSKVVTHCNYELITLEEREKGESRLPLADAVGYLFAADTNEYYVESYQAAKNGELKRVDQAGTKQYSQKAEYEKAAGSVTFRALGTGTVLMVVCDTLNEIYMYKQVEIPEGMDNDVIVRLTFYPYKFANNSDTVFLVNKWIQKK